MPVSRRDFLIGSSALPLLAAKKPVETPNLLLLLADGLPDWMVGCYGNREVQTPNLDRLAQTGMRFLDHIVCTPVAGPSRNSMLTGRTPMQLGGGDTLPAGEVTLEKLLGEAGYACQKAEIGPAGQFGDFPAAGKPFFQMVDFSALKA